MDKTIKKFDNLETVQDKQARTLSYFCIKDNLTVTQKVIAWLIKESENNRNCDARISLHKSPSDNFHEMIILLHKGIYRRPHKHLKKGESFHMIEGKMAVFVFNDNGSIKDWEILSKEEKPMYRIGIGQWHMVLPLTNRVVFHEMKPGPFIREGDSLFPDWTPDGLNIEETKRYMQKLLDITKEQTKVE